MLLFPLPSPCLLVTCLSLSLPVLPSFSLKPSRPPPGSYMLRLCRIAPGLSFCLLPRSVPSLLWGAGVARTDTQILASCPCFPRTSAPYPYPHLPDSSSKLSSSKIPDLPSALACQPERCLQCFSVSCLASLVLLILLRQYCWSLPPVPHAQWPCSVPWGSPVPSLHLS